MHTLTNTTLYLAGTLLFIGYPKKYEENNSTYCHATLEALVALDFFLVCLKINT